MRFWLLLLNYRMILILLAALVLAACQRQNEIQLTLIAQNATLQSEIEAVRQTATVDAERLQITVAYAGTLVGRAEEQRAQLQATLVARGADPASLGNVQVPLNTPFPMPGGTPDPANAAVPTIAGDVVVTPEAPAQPALTNVVMASGVGSDDCALNPTNNFVSSIGEIYVVATGENITAGTNIAARFSVAGTEIRHDFTPDFDIDGACIWFFIDEADLEFRPGTWSVTLELNGVSATSPIPFTITGDEAAVESG
jgi:hypothetical protein